MEVTFTNLMKSVHDAKSPKSFSAVLTVVLIKTCSDERQNGFKSLKLKRCKILQQSFIPCERDCFCLKGTLMQI